MHRNKDLSFPQIISRSLLHLFSYDLTTVLLASSQLSKFGHDTLIALDSLVLHHAFHFAQPHNPRTPTPDRPKRKLARLTSIDHHNRNHGAREGRSLLGRQ
jgi:hypothetical protein